MIRQTSDKWLQSWASSHCKKSHTVATLCTMLLPHRSLLLLIGQVVLCYTTYCPTIVICYIHYFLLKKDVPTTEENELIIECSPLTLLLKPGIKYTECCIKMFTKIELCSFLSYATTCMPASHAFNVACRTSCIIVTVCHWFYFNFF